MLSPKTTSMLTNFKRQREAKPRSKDKRLTTNNKKCHRRAPLSESRILNPKSKINSDNLSLERAAHRPSDPHRQDPAQKFFASIDADKATVFGAPRHPAAGA